MSAENDEQERIEREAKLLGDAMQSAKQGIVLRIQRLKHDSRKWDEAQLAELEDCKAKRDAHHVARMAEFARNEKQAHDYKAIAKQQVQLSFRDQCAIAAMQGLLDGILTRCSTISKGTVAADAFSIADAMEAELQKRNNNKVDDSEFRRG